MLIVLGGGGGGGGGVAGWWWWCVCVRACVRACVFYRYYLNRNSRSGLTNIITFTPRALNITHGTVNINPKSFLPVSSRLSGTGENPSLLSSYRVESPHCRVAVQ